MTKPLPQGAQTCGLRIDKSALYVLGSVAKAEHQPMSYVASRAMLLYSLAQRYARVANAPDNSSLKTEFKDWMEQILTPDEVIQLAKEEKMFREFFEIITKCIETKEHIDTHASQTRY